VIEERRPAPTVPEAELKRTDAGIIPQGEGWFVLNARDVSWIRSEERGQDTDFEGGQEWAQLGVRIQVLGPGQRGMYHGERGQEAFLVVSGECILVIEGQERRLKAWDFVHCPPWTKHVFVGAGDAPCVIVMAGSRANGFEVVYAVSEVAAKYDASVPQETSSPDEAYARWGPEERTAYAEGWLPSRAIPVLGRREHLG
jgi:quercetin dioxygenase-like cupin family protein